MGTPNDIYHHTRTSLMDIVSANVADHTLESVMDASGLSQDTINADNMMQLIRGPIYREFQTIVPKDGLKRQLTKLLGELQKANQEAIASASAVASIDEAAALQGQSNYQSNASQAANKAANKAGVRTRVVGITTINANAIGVPRAYFKDPRDDAFHLQMPLYGTDPHVVLDNGTRAVVRYWISTVALLGIDELKKAGISRYNFVVEEESHPNPTIVKLLEMLREEEEAEREARMLERLAIEAKAAAEHDVASAENVANAKVSRAVKAIQLTQEDINMLVGQYAELEEVRLIATLRRDGQGLNTINTRGKGLDIELVKPSILESFNKLSFQHFQAQYPQKTELFSKCKSILLEHETGLLYLLDYGDTIVLIYGTNDLNIGLMYSYAAMASVKENTGQSTGQSTTEITDEDFKEMA